MKQNNFSRIKKVLMCRPSFFSVEYKINPWMKIGAVNKTKAIEQWLNLVGIYQRHDIQVEIIDQKKDLPDMVFAADQGLRYGDKHFLHSRFRYKQRRLEANIYHQWLKNRDYKIKSPPAGIFFEGSGDALNYDFLPCFMGYGFRNHTNIAAHAEKMLGKRVILLKLINPWFYHLDTCLFILNRTTAFYYPEAFSSEAKFLLRKNFSNLFELEKNEAFGFAANSIVHGNVVFAAAGNPIFTNRLKNLGYQVVEVVVDEFFKAGGAIHCLTLILEKNYFAKD
jgi:N-dimethylarginine dimethylaminohydrolase